MNLDELKVKARELADVAMDKAKDASTVARLKWDVSSVQRELNKNYQALGHWFASEYRNQAPEEVKDVLAAIDVNKEKLAELQEKLKDYGWGYEEDFKVCPNCGAESNSKYCPECGAEMPE